MSFFQASKVGWVFIQPINLLLLLAFLGLLGQSWRPRAGRALALIAVGALLFINFAPVGPLLLRPLEMRFPVPPADMPAPYGIIVLGGAIDDEQTKRHGEVDLQEGASRLTEAALLARRYPDARVFYTGGSGFGPSDEAEEARDLLVGLGVPRERIGLETRSANTDENARFSAAILKPQPGQVWLVVTSAFHMPRSMGLFRKAGFDAVAYPVDFRTFGDERDWRLQLFRLSGLSTFDLATHEWTGLLAYYLAGKIGDLFPAPKPHSE